MEYTTFSDFHAELIAAFKRNMRENNISQSVLAGRLQDLKFPLAQGTISKILAMHVGINSEQIFYFCKALNLPLPTIPGQAEKKRSSWMEFHKNLSGNPADSLLSRLFGGYHCYFFSPNMRRIDIRHAILRLQKSEDGQSIAVEYERETASGEKIKSLGKAFFTQQLLNVYCIVSDENGIHVIAFPYPFLMPAEKKQFVALYLSVTEDIEPAPIVSRMIVSRMELDEAVLESTCSELLMNDSNILISEKELSALQELGEDFESLIDVLKRYGGDERYYKIPEVLLDSELVDITNIPRVINTLRKHSVNRPYYRITSQQNAFLSEIMTDLEGEDEHD